MMYSLDRPSARVIGRDEYDDDYDDDATIELELNESAIRVLNEAAAVALAAFAERAEPRLTPEANELRIRGLEQETRAGGRGPVARAREAPAARQASEAFEQKAPDVGQACEAFEQKAPAVGQASEAVEQKVPAARQASEAFEQKAPAVGQTCEAFEQEAPAARQQVGKALGQQETPPAERVVEALKQEPPAGSRGTVSVARSPRKSRQFALGLGMAAAAAGLLGGVAYLATARAPRPIPIVADSGSRPTAAPEAPTSAPALTPLATLPATPPETPDVPVRFKNPFDASEVFEFPAGMSRTEVRDAVAEMLSQRARERQSLFVKRPRRNTKAPDRDASVTASRVTPRS
jgi:hypothetical protein